MIRVFIGYDEREEIAFRVLASSIWRRASEPVSIVPLRKELLKAKGIYLRKDSPTESTDFSFTRFLVPFLCDYEGWAIFMDCDMLCLADICQIHAISRKWLTVVKHDYTPRSETKFLGAPQLAYPRKNWSSLMLFWNPAFHALTPEYVAESSAADLHQLAWVPDEQIGSIPLEWNWLVGEYPKNDDAKILHFTEGGPWFPEYRDCDHAEEWLREAGLGSELLRSA